MQALYYLSMLDIMKERDEGEQAVLTAFFISYYALGGNSNGSH